ncbi:uncharacterized protein RHO25_008803 [Cercospora beticola]|uniref:Uncharacterized protein n=1 Tax=Cercospora beticola TaxID=122368 RepID=A0ABZ0NXL8_CERBT|nr:hypothetical protein RHO25_008803 [Cercospora beticola]
MAYANSIAFALQQDPRLPTSVPRGETIISVSSSFGLLLIHLHTQAVGPALVHVRENAGCDFRAAQNREKGRDSAVARAQDPSVAWQTAERIPFMVGYALGKDGHVFSELGTAMAAAME